MFRVRFLEDGNDVAFTTEDEKANVKGGESYYYSQERPFLAPMTRNERLTAEDHFQVGGIFFLIIV